MRCPATEGRMKCLDDAARLNQENHIDKIAHAAVRRDPRHRIGMKLFGELLFTLDHRDRWRSNSGETKPIAHAGLLRRIKNDVTNSDVRMELGA